MPKTLTDREVSNAPRKAAPYRLSAGGSLFLEVRPSGEKVWRYRYRLGGKQNIFVIGRYYDKSHPEHVSLEAARQRCNEARVLVKQGINPTTHRAAQLQAAIGENANTFKAIAQEWIAKKRTKWTAYYTSQVERSMKFDVYPKIGAMPIKAITPGHILNILQEVERRGAETVAINVRQWCSAVFRYAIPTQRAETDPAAMLRGVVERPAVRHKTPVARNDFPALLSKIDSCTYRTTAIAMRLLLLTFVRPVELRASQWPEFDFDRAEWRIPPRRMKMREAHIIPLSTQAMDLLRELKTITGGGPWLFPNLRRPSTYMTATTMNRALERMGFGGKYSAHGFRTTASTILNELGYEGDWIERQLAHRPRNQSRAAYNHAQDLSDRRRMMQEWSDLVDAWSRGDHGAEKVIPLRARSGGVIEQTVAPYRRTIARHDTVPCEVTPYVQPLRALSKNSSDCGARVRAMTK
jgi:integrase